MPFSNKQNQQKRLAELTKQISKLEQQINRKHTLFNKFNDIDYKKRQVSALKIIKADLERRLNQN